MHSCRHYKASILILLPSIMSFQRFVTFHSWKEASKAIECYDGFSLGGDIKLRVKVAKKKRQRGSDLTNDLDYSFGEETNSDSPDGFSFTSASEEKTNER